jgi:hypothetical protein
MFISPPKELFYYKKTHVPTNTITIEKLWFKTHEDFLDKLNHWNRTDPKNWLFEPYIEGIEGQDSDEQ